MALSLLFAACASAPRVSRTLPRPGGWTEEGLASWYGEPYHGRQTASGEVYDMWGLTAAHRTLPFGTTVRVTNLVNHRVADVVITDRGPFVAGRILDLSRGAARALDCERDGVVPVRLEVVSPGDGMVSEQCWEVQIGAFAERANVHRAEQDLQASGLTTRTLPAGGGLTRVRVEARGGRGPAEELARSLAGRYPGATSVPCGGVR